mmetsp:Transcript_67079/g.212306  ORF Transcript_67079/g.212306 Transcript_67079/m.212306 type:complete len:394 (+) Transcript_67079:757-1938(+)
MERHSSAIIFFVKNMLKSPEEGSIMAILRGCCPLRLSTGDATLETLVMQGMNLLKPLRTPPPLQMKTTCTHSLAAASAAPRAGARRQGGVRGGHGAPAPVPAQAPPAARGARRTQALPPRASVSEGAVDSSAPVTSRRGLLLAAAALAAPALAAPALAALPPSPALLPLAEYVTDLKKARGELEGIDAAVAALIPARGGAEGEGGLDPELEDLLAEYDAGTPVSPVVAAAAQRQLHRGYLAAFWTAARGADRYGASAAQREQSAKSASGASAFARDQPDMFALIPEKTGPWGGLVRPDFDDPDDPTCLLYACVNDPGAPASIEPLYALKLLDQGLLQGAKGKKGVTAEGLREVTQSCIEKLSEYIAQAEARDPTAPPGAAPPPDSRDWGSRGI